MSFVQVPLAHFHLAVASSSVIGFGRIPFSVSIVTPFLLYIYKKCKCGLLRGILLQYQLLQLLFIHFETIELFE